MIYSSETDWAFNEAVVITTLILNDRDSELKQAVGGYTERQAKVVLFALLCLMKAMLISEVALQQIAAIARRIFDEESE